ncbi:MAG TPA: papain-like cysteine protease family protein [Allosphingosinicella sp.]|jgi:hypothetical protein
MTAQIRPNRMDVSDRFPMLGFSVRTGQPNVEAEVVLASDVTLFAPENRAKRTAANFYSSREQGVLTVPRGEGVFVVAPEVLARFIGSDRLFFGLATAPAGTGALTVDALPRDGSPYVSLRGFTGRTLRRNTGAGRGGGAAPRLEWAGDTPQPGAPVPDTARRPEMAGAGAGSAAGAPPAAGGGAGGAGGHYDDGFGPLPAIPARETAFRAGAMGVGGGRVGLAMTNETTAQGALEWIMRRVEQVVGAVGDDVGPPHLYRLGANSGTFISVWETVLGTLGVFSGFNAFLAALPALARSSGVTLSIGPALDTPVFGGGVGVAFAPDGQVALFGAGEISVDVSGLREFITSLKVALQAKMKLGYNRGGLDGFASLAKVGAVNAGEEIVVGAEIWLNSAGQGIGGAVSIGVGMALQLALEEEARQARQAYQAGQIQRPAGLAMSASTTARQALDWIMEKVRQGAAAAGSEVNPPSLLPLGGASGTFTSAWQVGLGATGLLNPAHAFLATIPTIARETGVTLSIGPALETPVFGGGIGVVFAPDGQVALFGTADVNVSLEGLQEFVSSLKLALQARIKLGYNRDGLAGFASLRKVAAISLGEEIVGGAELWLDGSNQGIGGAVSIGVGFALQLGVEESAAQPAIVRPSLPGDARQRAQRIGGGFAPRIGEALDRGLDERSLAPLLDTLDPPAAPQPLSYARGAMARQQATSRSINWDDVELIAQPTGNSCWAAAATMVIGWRDRVSLTPDTVADICSRSINQGLNPYDRVAFAAEIGLETEPPQSYGAEAFYNLLARKGPLWVSKVPTTAGGGHAVVVTGLYFDGDQAFVRVADPWDRVVGTPGAPGNYGSTHGTGSRYIMRYEDFQNEYELRIVGNPPTPQILHAGGTDGRTPNTGTDAAPQGYAMSSPSPSRRAAASPGARSMDAGAIATIAGTAVTIAAAASAGDIDWRLPAWPGKKHPTDQPPATEAPYREAITELAGWPQAGGVYLNTKVRWHYNGTSLGAIYVEPAAYNDTIGWGVTVTGEIQDDPRLHPRSPLALAPGPDAVPALHVVLTHVFQAPPLTDDPTAKTRLTLYADGTHEIDREWTRRSGTIPDLVESAQPGGGVPDVARTNLAVPQ